MFCRRKDAPFDPVLTVSFAGFDRIVVCRILPTIIVLAVAISALLPGSANAVSVAFLANVVLVLACVPANPWYGHLTLCIGLAMSLANKGQPVVAGCLWLGLELGIAKEYNLIPRRLHG